MERGEGRGRGGEGREREGRGGGEGRSRRERRGERRGDICTGRSIDWMCTSGPHQMNHFSLLL